MKINIGNSYSQITGLTSENYRKLKKALSYIENPDAKYYGNGFIRSKSLLDKSGSFPTGLLHIVLKIFSNTLLNDLRHKPALGDRIYIKCPKPYEWQLKAAYAAAKHGRGGIVAPTGTGKSLAMALIIAQFNVKTLVVVPNLEIKNQLKSVFESYFGQKNRIVVENIDSKTLKSHKNFDLLILDEVHHAASKTYQKLNKTVWNNIFYRFFFSATYFRNNTNEQLLFEAVAGEPIYELSYLEAIKKDYICPVKAYYIDLPIKPIDGYTWNEVYSEAVVNNTERNLIISKILKFFVDSEIPTICLVKEIAHGEKINEITGVSFVCGEKPESRVNLQEFVNGNTKAIIGTYGVLSEGVDTRPAEVVIVAGLGKARSALLQQVGRAVRKYPNKDFAKIILFRDKSHKFTLRHFHKQKKILREFFNIDVKLLSILEDL